MKLLSAFHCATDVFSALRPTSNRNRTIQTKKKCMNSRTSLCVYLTCAASPEAIRRGLIPMCEAAKSGKQVDLLEISTMREKIDLLPSDQKIKAKLLNILGNVCSKYHKSRELDDLNGAVDIYADAIREAGNNFEFSYWGDLGISLPGVEMANLWWQPESFGTQAISSWFRLILSLPWLEKAFLA